MAQKWKHGTLQRYRLELQAKAGTCAACRAANARHHRLMAERRKQRDGTGNLSLVEFDPLLPERSIPDRSPATSPDIPQGSNDPGVGPVDPNAGDAERGVLLDIRTIATTTPFYYSLKASALALARELDSGKGSKAPVAKELRETIAALRGKDTRDASTFEKLLDGIGAPLIGGPEIRNEAESE